MLLPLVSLTLKIMRSEGALLAVNLMVLVKSGSRNFYFLGAGFIISLLMLAQLYGFNDAWDAPRDMNDPDKPREIAGIILARRGAFLLASALWAVLLSGVAYLCLPAALYAVLAMISVNTVYSILLKGIPLLDVLTVILWGACFPGLTGFPLAPELLLAAGLMTGISHVWQTLRDKTADKAQRVRTIAVFSENFSVITVFFLCCVLMLIVAARADNLGGELLVVLCAAPLLIYSLVPGIRKVWFLSKLVFAVLWAGLLFLY